MVTKYNCYSFNDEWYLIEMSLTEAPGDIRFDEICVPEKGVSEMDWQAPLTEQFLNSDGTEKLCKIFDMPSDNTPGSRVAFFIYKTGSHVLQTPYGQFELGGNEKVPDRLKSIIEVDDEYITLQ